MNYKTIILLTIKKFFTKDMVKNISCGDQTYGNLQIIQFDEGSKIQIGNYCSISKNVMVFLGGNHRTDWVSTYPFPALDKYWPNSKNIKNYNQSKGDVVIGNDVWIGYGVSIMSGVNIGDGAVIGANSTVSKDVPPYSIAVGNPAIIVKKRFTDSQINSLLKIKWWNWSTQKINQNIKQICSPNIQEFINKHAK